MFGRRRREQEKVGSPPAPARSYPVRRLPDEVLGVALGQGVETAANRFPQYAREILVAVRNLHEDVMSVGNESEMVLAQRSVRRGSYEAAERSLVKLVEKKSYCGTAMVCRGSVMAAQGRHAEACAYLQDALGLLPNDPRLRWACRLAQSGEWADLAKIVKRPQYVYLHLAPESWMGQDGSSQ